LEALCPQSHCEHHLQDVVLLDDCSNEDILVLCGMSEDRSSCAVRRHDCQVNLRSQSIDILLEIYVVGGEFLQSVYVNPHMRTTSLCVMGSPYANILAIPARTHTGIPICIRRSLYANLRIR
jgi:hypothetical protein